MRNVLTIIMFFACIGIVSNIQAQTEAEVAQMVIDKTAKEAEAAKIKGELDAVMAEIAGLKAAIDKTIKWRFGSGGLLGLDINNFNNWAPKPDLNSSAQSISFSYNGFANLIEDKYFWRNNGGLNLGWLKYDEDSQTTGDDDGFDQVADIFNVQSLFGYNLTKNLALSALGEYRTTLLSNFNNPGFLDMGVGFTYTPIPNFVLVVHPLNYNFIFAKEATDFTSSLGAKVVADYNTKIADIVTWRSNLSGFLSYEGTDLSNYTWINGFNFAAYKGIGIGFELGLRWYPQETEARSLESAFQNYYQVGISYTIQ
ncbi:DUF3078 domain-containing protein [Portibacter lacus]|uniref:DUF3078 domain-containing protein n=1 Tax=Portibacter lacus TaxID=1099794 RepID=A0AA37WE92_9BACT|nr:DUF3078 domain-containing protein [Portibacter lacus]GLR17728.1 hypothetical protein GCM10007940_23430 [Portibacter lacus]